MIETRTNQWQLGFYLPLNLLDTSTPVVDRSKLKTITFVWDGDAFGALYMDDMQSTE